MIKVSMEGMCHECPFADVELNTLYATGLSGGRCVVATCVHEPACMRIWKMYHNNSTAAKACDDYCDIVDKGLSEGDWTNWQENLRETFEKKEGK